MVRKGILGKTQTSFSPNDRVDTVLYDHLRKYKNKAGELKRLAYGMLCIERSDQLRVLSSGMKPIFPLVEDALYEISERPAASPTKSRAVPARRESAPAERPLVDSEFVPSVDVAGTAPPVKTAPVEFVGAVVDVSDDGSFVASGSSVRKDDGLGTFLKW